MPGMRRGWLCLGFLGVVTLFGMIVATPGPPFVVGEARAEAADAGQKAEFDAAKELGTVEAWEAFLSHHPDGVYADLARAYVKSLGTQPAAIAPEAAAREASEFPMPAGSWGGIVRDGPSQNYRKVGSLQEGDPVTLIERTNTFENGFPWYRIAYSGGGSGYQWGGILCAIGEPRADLFQTCTTAAERDDARASAPRRCRENGGEWGEGQCWPKGHYKRQAAGGGKKRPANTTGLSCKDLKARCSKTDTNYDCDRYLNSCTGHGDN